MKDLTEKNVTERKKDATKIMKKYPDRIPVIINKLKKSDISDIDKNKFLVPNDLTVGQFGYIIRKRIKLEPSKALFIFVNNTLPATSSIISQIYNDYKSEDDFLYMMYSGENTFGNK